jgi:hypothetical protein
MHGRGSLLVRQGKVAVGARSAWRLGLGAAVALARRPGRAAGRAAALHHRRVHSWPVLVELRGPGRVPSACRPGRSAAAFRAASAAPRPRRRACPRGRGAQRHPTPARPRQPRHDQLYLQGIDTEEIIATVHARRAPMMSATAGLRALTETPLDNRGSAAGAPAVPLWSRPLSTTEASVTMARHEPSDTPPARPERACGERQWRRPLCRERGTRDTSVRRRRPTRRGTFGLPVSIDEVRNPTNPLSAEPVRLSAGRGGDDERRDLGA